MFKSALLLDHSLEERLDLSLYLGHDDLGHLVIHALDLLREQGHDDVADVLANDAFADSVFHSLADGCIHLLLLLLLPREQLLQLVRLLGQLLVLASEFA